MFLSLPFLIPLMTFFCTCTIYMKKSPKKCCALDDIAYELKLCFEPSEVSRTGGIFPLCACGIRFVAHR